jgi:predicted RNase H-like HicB family nuclease
MTDAHLYPTHVFWSDEDEGYIAVATDLPGCSAFGDTQSEALRELQDAIAAWIEAQQAVGNPVPEPSRPSREYSGKVLLRMPRSLHAKLALAASDEDVSLNQYIVHVLSAGSMDPRSHKAPVSLPPIGGKARTGETRSSAKAGASGRLIKAQR